MFKIVSNETEETIARDFASVELAEKWCEQQEIDLDDVTILSY